ncbi:hypothetical protein DIPPA_30247 [Diplonema papillatum]|nr:hypothetical protein DIPPA_30247 [Diplonema papillatum]
MPGREVEGGGGQPMAEDGGEAPVGGDGEETEKQEGAGSSEQAKDEPPAEAPDAGDPAKEESPAETPAASDQAKEESAGGKEEPPSETPAASEQAKEEGSDAKEESPTDSPAGEKAKEGPPSEVPASDLQAKDAVPAASEQGTEEAPDAKNEPPADASAASEQAKDEPATPAASEQAKDEPATPAASGQAKDEPATPAASEQAKDEPTTPAASEQVKDEPATPAASAQAREENADASDPAEENPGADAPPAGSDPAKEPPAPASASAPADSNEEPPESPAPDGGGEQPKEEPPADPSPDDTNDQVTVSSPTEPPAAGGNSETKEVPSPPPEAKETGSEHEDAPKPADDVDQPHSPVTDAGTEGNGVERKSGQSDVPAGEMLEDVPQAESMHSDTTLRSDKFFKNLLDDGASRVSINSGVSVKDEVARIHKRMKNVKFADAPVGGQAMLKEQLTQWAAVSAAEKRFQVLAAKRRRQEEEDRVKAYERARTEQMIERARAVTNLRIRDQARKVALRTSLKIQEAHLRVTQRELQEDVFTSVSARGKEQRLEAAQVVETKRLECRSEHMRNMCIVEKLAKDEVTEAETLQKREAHRQDAKQQKAIDELRCIVKQSKDHQANTSRQERIDAAVQRTNAKAVCLKLEQQQTRLLVQKEGEARTAAKQHADAWVQKVVSTSPARVRPARLPSPERTPAVPSIEAGKYKGLTTNRYSKVEKLAEYQFLQEGEAEVDFWKASRARSKWR